jgi:hypothetical protein
MVRDRTDCQRYRSHHCVNVGSCEQMMCAQRSEKFQRQRACEFLARESQVPLDEVERLYEDEWAKLALDARMTGYLNVFTVRNVRNRLRARSKVELPPG